MKVVITPDYQHVGNIAQHAGDDLLDVERRRLFARQVFAPLHKRLLYNPHLSVVEKRTLVLSMVGRKLMHGAGQWALRNAKEYRMFHAGYMCHWRKCERPLIGVSFADATDFEVCAMLGVLEPAEALAVERIRALVNAMSGDAGYLARVLIADKWWMPKVCHDSKCAVEVTGVDVGVDFGMDGCTAAVVNAFKTNPVVIKKVVRMFITKRR